jgi:hypothetical protein
MGHRRLIRQKEGKQFKWCWLDHLLYLDRTPTGGYLLGEVNLGKFVQGRNARPLCFTLTCTGGGQVLQGGKWSAILCCDNKSALELSSHHRRCIRPNTKCTDIQRNLRAIKQTLTRNFKYVHVYGHMDQYLKWEQLTLIQQLNCVCDTLAKRAIITATLQGYHSRQSQLLPKEDVALVIWGNKVTGDISSPLRFHASK